MYSLRCISDPVPFYYAGSLDLQVLIFLDGITLWRLGLTGLPESAEDIPSTYQGPGNRGCDVFSGYSVDDDVRGQVCTRTIRLLMALWSAAFLFLSAA